MAVLYDIDDLKFRSSKKHSMKAIAASYGVTVQALYKVFQKNQIPTPWVDKKSFLKTLSVRQLWLLRTIRSKGVQGQALKSLVLSLELPDVCPVLGIPLRYTGTGYRTEDRASVDQIVPGAGYYLGNIAIVSWRANRIKNDGTPDEHRKIYEYYSALGSGKK